MKRRTWLWLLALLITLVSAIWQRLSGPTYPIRVHGELAGVTVRAKLLRTHETSGDLPVRLRIEKGLDDRLPGGTVGGVVSWRRYPSADTWQEILLTAAGEDLYAAIPAQPAAGKVEYRLVLRRGDEQLLLPERQAVVARFKGAVPKTVLFPHILAIFLGMLWSSRAGLEALTGGTALQRQVWTTLVLLVIGGLLLGPVIQKLAFGSFWTGWPLGDDLTDNKLAVAAAAWLVAALRCRNGGGRGAVLAAAVVTLAIFAIPHSLHGSTLDYHSGQTVSG